MMASDTPRQQRCSHDALYLAVAEQQDTILVTDDRRLLTAIRGDAPLRGNIAWIGDYEGTG